MEKKFSELNKSILNKGFTLAELMVVVAILGILVTVSIVLFGGHSEEAKKAACDANKTAIEQAMTMEEVNGLEMVSSMTSEKLGLMFQSAVASIEDGGECPAGGKYEIRYHHENDVNSWFVYCTVHDGDGSLIAFDDEAKR